MCDFSFTPLAAIGDSSLKPWLVTGRPGIINNAGEIPSLFMLIEYYLCCNVHCLLRLGYAC